MGFLTPLFVGGLAAIGVPIAIHMINRERRVVVEFPSLMFLHKIPYKSVRRQKIRHLLLLMLRCLALAMLVFAFSRPFLHKPPPAVAAGSGAREVVILVDRSYSMGYGNRWNMALDSARAVVSKLTAADRATVVFFDNDASAATEPTADHARLNAVINHEKLSDEGTRYVPALKLAGQIVGGSNLPRKEIDLITDFQAAGWAKREEIALPPGVTLQPIDVSGGKSGSDAAVVSVTTDRDQADNTNGSRDHVTVAARLTNTGALPRTVDAVLEMGGRKVDTRHVTIPAHGAAPVTFSSILVPEAATRGRVFIDKDSLQADDSFQFSIAPDEAVSVLVINPLVPRANQSLYVQRALKILDRPRFTVTIKKLDEVRPTDLEGRSLVILNEVPPPSGDAGTRLRDLVSAGGGLVVVPGQVTMDKWPADWRAILPAHIGAVVDRTNDGTAGATISYVDFSNPIFELFSAPRSGSFSGAHVYRYRALSAPGDTGVVARFDDGAPAMIEHSVGAGKVVVWATTLDEFWTDLPLQPVFLPFMAQLAKHVGLYSDTRSWFMAGDVLDLSRHAELTTPLLGAAKRAAGDSGALILEAPSGEKTRLSVEGSAHLATLREAGFYELRAPSTAVGGGRPIGVNVDPAEADLTHLDPKELLAAASASTVAAEKRGAPTGTPEEQERRQTIWWYVLLAALFVLAAETVMSNRLSRATS